MLFIFLSTPFLYHWFLLDFLTLISSLSTPLFVLLSVPPLSYSNTFTSMSFSILERWTYCLSYTEPPFHSYHSSPFSTSSLSLLDTFLLSLLKMYYKLPISLNFLLLTPFSRQPSSFLRSVALATRRVIPLSLFPLKRYRILPISLNFSIHWEHVRCRNLLQGSPFVRELSHPLCCHQPTIGWRVMVVDSGRNWQREYRPTWRVWSARFCLYAWDCFVVFASVLPTRIIFSFLSLNTRI